MLHWFLHSLWSRRLRQRPDFGFLTGDVVFALQAGRREVRVTLFNLLHKCVFPVFVLLQVRILRPHLQARVHRGRALQRALHALLGVRALALRLFLIPLIQGTFLQGTFLQGTVVLVALSLLLLVLLVRLALARPADPVLLLQAPPRVGEPGGDLREAHLGDDGQHDLLALGRVRVLQVLVQPGLQRPGALSRGHLGDPAGVLGCTRPVGRVEGPPAGQERVMVGRCGLQVETVGLENKEKTRKKPARESHVRNYARSWWSWLTAHNLVSELLTTTQREDNQSEWLPISSDKVCLQTFLHNSICGSQILQRRLLPPLTVQPLEFEVYTQFDLEILKLGFNKSVIYQLTMCAMCLWCGYGMKLYPCSPEYPKGIPAAIAARCWACCWCTLPSIGIWYPVGMLRFRSKKKLPNPVWDAGIFPASRLFVGLSEWQPQRLDPLIYSQLPACVCVCVCAGGGEGGEGLRDGGGGGGGCPTGIDWQLRSKDPQLSLATNPIKEALRCSFLRFRGEAKSALLIASHWFLRSFNSNATCSAGKRIRTRSFCTSRVWNLEKWFISAPGFVFWRFPRCCLNSFPFARFHCGGWNLRLVWDSHHLLSGAN